MHSKETRQTKAGTERKSQRCLVDETICIYIMYMRTQCAPNSLALPDALSDVYAWVFCYVKRQSSFTSEIQTKKELATEKCSTIIIYNCLDNETNNDKHCTNTYRQLQRTALEVRSRRSDKAWTPRVAAGTIPEKD